MGAMLVADCDCFDPVCVFQLGWAARIWRDIDLPIADLPVDLSCCHPVLLARQAVGAQKDGDDQGRVLTQDWGCPIRVVVMRRIKDLRFDRQRSITSSSLSQKYSCLS
jgi:hypothetical protein